MSRPSGRGDRTRAVLVELGGDLGDARPEPGVRRIHRVARVPPQHLGDRGQVERGLEEPDVGRAPQVPGRAFGHHRHQVGALQQEAEELARLGCRYIQVDAPDFGQLAARISEAGGFFPREQLALSTPCGFASAGPGNAISEDAQENKLRLVAEVADRVWGTGG
jgi:hypothetical protein